MAGRVDAGHRTRVVHFARITSDPYGSDDLPGGIADELTARLQEHRSIGQFHQIFHEYRFLALLLQHKTRWPSHRQGRIGLAVCDLKS